MKTAQIISYGKPIEINETDVPQIKSDQVLIEVFAASVNPFDVKVAEGSFGEIYPRLPATLGGDLSGEVIQVGNEVEELEIGSMVYGQAHGVAGNSGAYAEFAATSRGQIAKSPTNLNHLEAAAIPLTGVSALQVLEEKMNLQPGQKILIHGGAGGIGTIAIQFAKSIGAFVATTASSQQKEYVKELGADEIIDYQTQKFEEELHDFDAVLDTIGGGNYIRSFEVLKKSGVLVSMLEKPNQELMAKFDVNAIMQNTKVTTEWLQKLTKFIEKNNVKVHIEKTFPLNKVADAFEEYKNGKKIGKIIIDIKKG